MRDVVHAGGRDEVQGRVSTALTIHVTSYLVSTLRAKLLAECLLVGTVSTIGIAWLSAIASPVTHQRVSETMAADEVRRRVVHSYSMAWWGLGICESSELRTDASLERP